MLGYTTTDGDQATPRRVTAFDGKAVKCVRVFLAETHGCVICDSVVCDAVCKLYAGVCQQAAGIQCASVTMACTRLVAVNSGGWAWGTRLAGWHPPRQGALRACAAAV